MAVSSLWCSATNTIVIPISLIGPIILDITAILGTSPFGIPVDANLFRYPSTINLKALFNDRAIETLIKEGQEPLKEEVQNFYKNFLNYNTFYLHFAGREEENLRQGEHEAFLFYWYNKFICYTKSNKCLVENIPVAEALASGHTLALSPAILAHLLRCLAEMTHTKVAPFGYSNSGCRFIWSLFGQNSPASRLLKRSAFRWLLDQYLVTRLKTCLDISSALMLFLTTNS
ncbi:hypothetical protein ACFX1X_025267 [Malus domestica]